MVRGPESRVNALQKLETESIWLSGQKQTFTASNLGIDVPDTKVDLLDPVVTVQVEIAELPVERTYSGVPNGSGPPMTITVLGPPTMLDRLKPEDLHVVWESPSARVNPKLRLAPEFEGKVTLKSIKDALEQ
jgi:hypothetical protein